MKSGTGRGNHRVVWDGSGDPQGGLRWVVGTTERSGTGPGSLWEVWETLGEFRRTLWEVQGTLGEVGGPSRRSG